ncbi:hypothetical protein [Nocardioides sp. B-3]|uniref:hypothetical protein n=1 Tax=Nocardioides sp. B-3 TaxID=2895565 RepID=UPI0021527998|nr:hypothetical protein [Nocardioides sp. B-3]UUZ58324.1 hypothetical protein LP418_19195 [Nocardioides sp. B-3]
MAGRLGYARFAATTSVTSRGVIVLTAVAAATAALAPAPGSAGLLIGLGMVLGPARGIYTLVQGHRRHGPLGSGGLRHPQRHPHRPGPRRLRRRTVRGRRAGTTARFCTPTRSSSSPALRPWRRC